VNLTDLYDADKRTRDPVVRRIAERFTIPHPLHGIRYADGADYCTHAKRCITVLGQRAP
jgi:hypothetical protein